jgi:hypothetical protein
MIWSRFRCPRRPSPPATSATESVSAASMRSTLMAHPGAPEDVEDCCWEDAGRAAVRSPTSAAACGEAGASRKPAPDARFESSVVPRESLRRARPVASGSSACAPRTGRRAGTRGDRGAVCDGVSTCAAPRTAARRAFCAPGSARDGVSPTARTSASAPPVASGGFASATGRSTGAATWAGSDGAGSAGGGGAGAGGGAGDGGGAGAETGGGAGAGVGAGAGGGGGGVAGGAAGERAGRSPRGSMYVSSAPTRTPRCT